MVPLCCDPEYIFPSFSDFLPEKKENILSELWLLLLPYFTLQVREIKVYISQKNLVSLLVKYLFLEPQTQLQFSFSNENHDFVISKILLRTPKHWYEAFYLIFIRKKNPNS